MKILGIDASNIRGGGGVTHLVELLKIANIEIFGFNKVIIWGGEKTLSLIENRDWLFKINHPYLNKSLPFRIIWQLFILSKNAHRNKCDVLFIPGGTYWGRFKPFVTLSQNLLPFESHELKRYGISLMAIKMFILRYTQLYTFRKASGVIFLTSYAENVVTNITGNLKATIIIPHGIPLRFKQNISLVKKETKKFKIVYVSIIDVYKHQINVIKAISNLKNLGYDVSIDLIGPAYKPELNKLMSVINSIDPNNTFLNYVGPYPYKDLHQKYSAYDIFVFASTCENQPIILLEAMASGLPIACSNFGPMPELLKDAGLYFNPENITSISMAIKEYLDNYNIRYTNSNKSINLSNKFSWDICSNSTFKYLNKISEENILIKKNV